LQLDSDRGSANLRHDRDSAELGGEFDELAAQRPRRDLDAIGAKQRRLDHSHRAERSLTTSLFVREMSSMRGGPKYRKAVGIGSLGVVIGLNRSNRRAKHRVSPGANVTIGIGKGDGLGSVEDELP